MYWFPYLSLAINLLVIRYMPRRLTRKEIYVSWVVIALINLSTDVILSLYFRLYELNGGGVQLGVHIIELTLGASFGIIFLNFMPESKRSFFFYTAVWVIFSLLFEMVTVKLNFLNYFSWKWFYSAPYYFAAFLFVRWHLHFIRSN
ncbi:hypothetical protein NVV31_14480 [Cytobacillus firmus]|uniref:hypothetical protein n=1 Tax=Cytobacillus TaxID=2675230 RepID=UPI001D142274|nr:MULTISPECIES: hypothetical protein [Cytobacillus]MCC3647068.1 hypothetical protein [Cytobacillus oceanisediminis]MCU1806590.1 hypothetical protein [Cytobacillus firmus]